MRARVIVMPALHSFVLERNTYDLKRILVTALLDKEKFRPRNDPWIRKRERRHVIIAVLGARARG